MRSIAAALLLLPNVWALAGRADEPPAAAKPGGQWKLFAECRMATLPQTAALPLIAEFGELEKANEAWTHLEQMLEGGEAALEADLVVQGAEAKPLSSESVEEMRYGTEYEPPKLPQKLSLKAGPEAFKIWPLVGATPTAFETRKTGETIDFRARVLEDGAWIAVSVEATHTRFHKWDAFDFAELPGGARLAFNQPEFSTLKSKSSFRLRNGEKILIGVHKLATPKKTFELFVLQVKATRAGAKP